MPKHAQTITEAWFRMLALRDGVTEEHSRRATELAVRTGHAVGLPAHELGALRLGALLHDIGKLGIPDAILQKPGPLTPDEWDLMRQHPVLAYDVLAPLGLVGAALDVPLYHHEKWDGSGYPHGLIGDAIPLAARVFSVVDVWDALRSDRPYRGPMPPEETRAYIVAQSGTHFDPAVVPLFLAALDGSVVAEPN